MKRLVCEHIQPASYCTLAWPKEHGAIVQKLGRSQVLEFCGAALKEQLRACVSELSKEVASYCGKPTMGPECQVDVANYSYVSNTSNLREQFNSTLKFLD